MKKVLISLSILFLLLGGVLYAEQIDIIPMRFVATMRIQQINLYYRIESTQGTAGEQYDLVKAGMTNYGGINKGVLYIRPVDATGNMVDSSNNVSSNPDYASIMGGYYNHNNGDETSLILGGRENTVAGHGVVLVGGEGNTATVENAVILGSTNSTVGSTNGVIMAAGDGNVYGNNSTIFGGGGLIATGADNSFGIGGGINIIHPGVFSYGGAKSVKPNIAQFNAGKGVMVGWPKPNGNSNIKLSVNGALAVGRGSCTKEMAGSIYYKPGWLNDTEYGQEAPVYCLCACITSGSDVKDIALANSPYCDGVCRCTSDNPHDCQPDPAGCGTRGFSGSPIVYENGEKNWRVASKFCRDNRIPIAYTIKWLDGEEERQEEKVCPEGCIPPFPEPGQTVSWKCKGLGIHDFATCYAYRRTEAPDLAKCGSNAKRFKFNDTAFTGTKESDFCYYASVADGVGNRASNGELVAYRFLNPEQIENEYKLGKNVVPFTGDDLTYLGILNKLKENFPEPGWRTYWICETSNVAGEKQEGQEATNSRICYAEREACNHCAKDGFPYCFDVDFSENCNG